MLDIFDRIERDSGGPIGQYFEQGFGYYMYPRLEGELGPHMIFNGIPVLNWSLNNYLGLANHPEVRKADAQGAADWGLAYPMGARMMSGHTRYHEKLEKVFADFEKKEDAFLFNFGYQGIVSTIDALLARHDVVVYDAECHACLLDGIRLHIGSKYKYRHNNMADCDKVLTRACAEAEENGGGVLLITEGVYGMTGALGKLDEIVALKKKHKFRILIDDAHGFGLLGEHGRGTSEHFGVMDGIDLYIGAFAKSMASIGGFVAGPHSIINYLRANMRSQMYAKSLPMALVIGNLKRMEIIDSPEGDELRKGYHPRYSGRFQEGRIRHRRSRGLRHPRAHQGRNRPGDQDGEGSPRELQDLLLDGHLSCDPEGYDHLPYRLHRSPYHGRCGIHSQGLQGNQSEARRRSV